MLSTMKQLFNKSNKDLRHRIYFTLGALAIFILGINIRVPGTKDLTSDLGFLELINAMGGGALKNFSIFALGVMPYITASIIMQLLQMDIIPYFSELAKQGHTGRQKISKITRYMGIAFAFIEGYAFAFAFVGKSATPMQYLYISVVLTAGTAFLLWLGDQISQKGIGNGVSLIIMAGILATLPQMFIDAFNGLVTFGETTQATTLGIVKFALFVIVYFAIVIGVIFASSLMSVPGILAKVVNNSTFTLIAEKYLNYTTLVGFIIYALLIYFFAYFYTFIQLKPDDFAKNLQENGGYIPGVRPGDETSEYLSKILSRLTVVGSLFLIVIAGLPILFSKLTSLPTSVSIGGTGLLIVVGVALETYKQLESSILSRNYKRSYTRGVRR